ncbi:MAG: NAD(P)H-hydrate epimerase [Lachnospirales bacterium]
MENAAYGVKKEVLKFNPKSVIVFAGKGNNGGDGLAVSRQLMAMGY